MKELAATWMLCDTACVAQKAWTEKPHKRESSRRLLYKSIRDKPNLQEKKRENTSFVRISLRRAIGTQEI